VPEPLSVPPDTASVNDQFQVTDWAFATPPRASRDVNAIVFVKKGISNFLQLAIDGFDSASALTAFVTNWANHAEAVSAVTKQNYDRRQLSGCAMFNGALRRAFRKRDRQ
jgi:hypothetical protein